MVEALELLIMENFAAMIKGLLVITEEEARYYIVVTFLIILSLLVCSAVRS